VSLIGQPKLTASMGSSQEGPRPASCAQTCHRRCLSQAGARPRFVTRFLQSRTLANRRCLIGHPESLSFVSYHGSDIPW